MSASYGKSNREHSFVTITRNIKSGDVGNPILLWGVEKYLVDWSSGQLVNKYTNEATRVLDLTVFDQESVTVDQIILACETMAMMSERKVVLVKDLPLIKGKETKAIPKDDGERLKEYLGQVPPFTLLIFTSYIEEGEDPSRPSSFVTSIKKTGQVYDFDRLSRGDLEKFILQRFKAAGKKADYRAVDMLIETSGYLNKEMDYGLYNLQNDIKKMIALAEGDEIGGKQVEAGVSASLEHNTFKLLDAISNNQKDQAIRLLHDLLNSGAPTFKVLATVISQVELMLICKEMREEGKSLAEIKNLTKIHEYRLKKAIAFGEKYSLRKIRSMVTLALEVEKNIKLGILREEMAMEMMIGSM